MAPDDIDMSDVPSGKRQLVEEDTEHVIKRRRQEDTIATPTDALPILNTSQSTPSYQRPLNYACTWDGCGRVFSRPCRLEEHIRSHTGERPYLCDEPGCGKTFVRDYHLSRHKKLSHTDERPHHCSYNGCNLSFATTQRLRMHEQTHEKKNEYRCRDYPPCDEWFRKKSTLQAHINAIHRGLTPYICSHVDDEDGNPCQKGFQSASALNSHVDKAHGPPRYFCSICGTITPESISQGDTVMAESSVPGSPYSVSTAATSVSSAFRTEYQLQKHIQEVHPEQAPVKLRIKKRVMTHQCEHCGHEFTKLSNLENHVLVVHKKLRRFICGETDVSKSKHLLSGDGEQLWDSNKGCGHTFTTKSMLEDHIRIDHLGMLAKQTVRQRNKREAMPSRKSGNSKAKPVNQVARLLGQEFGDDGRDISCLVAGCSNKFFREYDLKIHCASAHEMADDEVAEALMERQALAGGPFWVGGIDPALERAGMSEDGQNQVVESHESMVIDPSLDQIDAFVDAVKRM